MLGMSIKVIPPGELERIDHWETEQEDFLVLAGEAILNVEGEDAAAHGNGSLRPLAPPETRHAFAGAGDAPRACSLAASSREFQKDGPCGLYCADETAARYNASSAATDTQDNDVGVRAVRAAEADPLSRRPLARLTAYLPDSVRRRAAISPGLARS